MIRISAYGDWLAPGSVGYQAADAMPGRSERERQRYLEELLTVQMDQETKPKQSESESEVPLFGVRV